MTKEEDDSIDKKTPEKQISLHGYQVDIQDYLSSSLYQSITKNLCIPSPFSHYPTTQ